MLTPFSLLNFSARTIFCLFILLPIQSAYLASNVAAQAASSSTKVYRGSLGDKHIQMKLISQGNQVSGAYSYDLFRQEIKLSGTLDAQGTLQLNEGGQKGKSTGKFTCKREREVLSAADLECEWTRPDGTGKSLVSLTEQHFDFQKVQVIPKTISKRDPYINVSYPQLADSNGHASPTLDGFNELITSIVKKAMADFAPEPTPARTSFDLDYNVLLGTDDLISIELNEYAYTGGAHPTTSVFALTYDLPSNKQLALEALFKDKSDFNTVLATYAVKAINELADQIEVEEARRSDRKPEKRAEPMMTSEQLPELSAWALTPKGLAIYFDFPHVMAVFDKTVVPFAVIRDQMRTDGPLARFAR